MPVSASMAPACSSASGRSPSSSASRSASAAVRPSEPACAGMSVLSSRQEDVHREPCLMTASQRWLRDVTSTSPGPRGISSLIYLGLVGVVEDQQPPAVRLTPPQRVEHRGDEAVDSRRGLRLHAEPGGQGGQRASHRRQLVGRDPPNEVVIVAGNGSAYSMASAVFPTPPSPWTPRGNGSLGPLSGSTAVIRLDAPSRSRARISSRPVKFLLRVGTPPQIAGMLARAILASGTVMTLILSARP